MPKKIRGTALNKMFTTTTQTAIPETTSKGKIFGKVQVVNPFAKSVRKQTARADKYFFRLMNFELIVFEKKIV